MVTIPTRPPRPLPSWLRRVGTAAVIFKIMALSTLVLAAPSGPWPTDFGSSTALAPFFAGKLNEFFSNVYWSPLRMTHNYHYLSNRPLLPSIFFDVNLKDKEGRTIKSLRFPSKEDLPWIRFRHQLLANGLGDDMPVPPPRGTVIPAPGQQMPRTRIWDPEEGSNVMKVRVIEEHLVPRDRPVYRPNEWALLLAKSYARHLCSQYGAYKAEVIRHSRDQVSPVVLLAPQLPPGTFNELVSSFGDITP